MRCVWHRHDLTSLKLRLKAFDSKVGQEGILLTEAQIAALENAKADKEAHDEFDSECPGLPPKPKGIWQRTHERLWYRFLEAEERTEKAFRL